MALSLGTGQSQHYFDYQLGTHITTVNPTTKQDGHDDGSLVDTCKPVGHIYQQAGAGNAI